MNNAGIIVATLVITIGIVVIFFYYLSQRKKRNLKTIAADWKAFQNAITHQRIQAIERLGTQLVYNEHITVKQMKEMSRVINTLENEHKELTELKWIIYNKRKDWSKQYPRHFDGPMM
ncbi:hypothetical protein LX97_02653 [Nonlabens dokdonensis]|uniref:Uncharacterized protein n=2 Tax=Nonlabens dokdonensis TaxID=328515 RepID=L7WHV4_NONDD|nr:hypothetical protein [Nonlabens dokdonensis]AGC78583.1 hypothetical protein DDD_3456 [Nonlabens dokdonensis DSW-6]PZX39287.1 hypothetical protein LX97_02653 [Nonlabens dokdonensis]